MKRKDEQERDFWSRVEHAAIRLILFILLIIGLFKLVAQEVSTLPFWK